MGFDVSKLTQDPGMGASSFTRLRPTTTTSGEGVPSMAYVSSPMIGIVVPAGPAQAKRLPEGVRLDDVRVFHTSFDVSAGDGAAQLPDVLRHGGKSYEVLSVLDLRQVGGLQVGYLQATARRFEPGTLPILEETP
jgi:hypothetical protein